jgi:hypothetical protein
LKLKDQISPSKISALRQAAFVPSFGVVQFVGKGYPSMKHFSDSTKVKLPRKTNATNRKLIAEFLNILITWKGEQKLKVTKRRKVNKQRKSISKATEIFAPKENHVDECIRVVESHNEIGIAQETSLNC